MEHLNYLDCFAESLCVEAIDASWGSIDEKLQFVICERAAGRTLQEIGNRLGVTRERVRQLQIKGSKQFMRSLDCRWQGWAEWGKSINHSAGILDIRLFIQRFPTNSAASTFIPLMLDWIGWLPQQNGSHWWLHKSMDVGEALKGLVFDEPITLNEWNICLEESGLPSDYLSYLIEEQFLALREYSGYMIRTKHQRLDKAHVFLLRNGPSSAKEIARAVGEKNVRSFEEFLRRQEKFTKNAVERKWCLSDSIEIQYRSATEALLDLLSVRGALSKKEILRAMAEIYPVSSWRVSQCLNDFRIGTMADGKYNLIERGAVRRSEGEPTRPDHMQCSGEIAGIRRIVNKDILRGSGINDSKWLAWKLGLHSTPMKRVFSEVGGFRELTVRRSGDNSQISALREVIAEMGLLEGCRIAIVLNIENRTWQLKHICPQCSAD